MTQAIIGTIATMALLMSVAALATAVYIERKMR